MCVQHKHHSLYTILQTNLESVEESTNCVVIINDFALRLLLCMYIFIPMHRPHTDQIKQRVINTQPNTNIPDQPHHYTKYYPLIVLSACPSSVGRSHENYLCLTRFFTVNASPRCELRLELEHESFNVK